MTMTATEAHHAQSAVESFRSLLDPEVCATISEESFDQLALLIESAVDTAVIEHLERVVVDLRELTGRVQRQAETRIA